MLVLLYLSCRIALPTHPRHSRSQAVGETHSLLGLGDVLIVILDRLIHSPLKIGRRQLWRAIKQRQAIDLLLDVGAKRVSANPTPAHNQGYLQLRIDKAAGQAALDNGHEQLLKPFE